MVWVVDCCPPVVVYSDLAVLSTGAEEDAGAQEDDSRGVTLHVSVVRSVGERVATTLCIKTPGQAPEHDIPVIISSHQSEQ